MSNPNNQLNFDTSAKLNKYLIDHAHWSPFEHVMMTVEIVTSWAIAQQIIRHRSFVFQEFSQRYAIASKFELYAARRQDVKNRQNSTDDLEAGIKTWFANAQYQVWEDSCRLYQRAIELGVAKECARFLLPLNTQTTIYMSGSIRSFYHYLQLRTDVSTQKEHRDIALEIHKIFIKEFPDIAEAAGWVESRQ